jgi:hypothetical protein
MRAGTASWRTEAAFLYASTAFVICACGPTPLLQGKDQPEVATDAALPGLPGLSDGGTSGLTPPLTPDPTCAGVLGNEAAPATSCGSMRLRIVTQEACSITLADCARALDGEAFQAGTCPDPRGIALECPDREKRVTSAYRILAMNRFGRGHVVGWCDSTTLTAMMKQVDVARYLGRTDTPRLASLGGGWPCVTGSLGEAISNATYLGPELPEEYRRQPDVLSRDWDAVVACPLVGSTLDGWVETLRPFVETYGRGLLITTDYTIREDTPPFDTANAIAGPAGFVFEAVNLGYSTVNAELTCVPDL